MVEMIKKKLCVVLCIIGIGVFTTSCVKETSLEAFFNSSEDAKKQIEILDNTDGLNFLVTGNTIVCEYDISEETSIDDPVKKKTMINTLKKILDDDTKKMQTYCGVLEEESNINNVSIKIIYKYKEHELISREYHTEK